MKPAEVVRKLNQDAWWGSWQQSECPASGEAGAGDRTVPRKPGPADRHDTVHRTPIGADAPAEALNQGADQGEELATRVYPALLIRDVAADHAAAIGVVFPDLPGCVSQGETPQQAAEMAMEALSLHVESMVSAGDPLPDPSPPGAVPDWLDPCESTVVTHLLVPVDVPGRNVRLNVTMDENRNG